MVGITRNECRKIVEGFIRHLVEKEIEVNESAKTPLTLASEYVNSREFSDWFNRNVQADRLT